MLAEPIAFSSRACPEKGNVSGRRRYEVKKILRLFLFTAFFLLTAKMQAQTVYITKTGAKYLNPTWRFCPHKSGKIDYFNLFFGAKVRLEQLSGCQSAEIQLVVIHRFVFYFWFT